MGGEGSGRPAGATRVAGRYGEDLTNLSRVELEPWLAVCVMTGTPEAMAQAEAIRVELAGREWQGTNPYAPQVA